MPTAGLWRALMWLCVVLAGAWLVLAVRAGQLGDGRTLAVGLIGATGLLIVAVTIGLRAARRRAREQAAAAAHTASMLLVAELGRHDDATLERIAAGGGPAADAARMILQGRHLGNPAGGPRHSSSES